MRNRIKYSQNFLTDSQLVESLIDKSSITANDMVIEIGAGEGIITKELIKKSKKVIAFELDNNFFRKLSKKFQNEKSLELKQEDFLESDLPAYPYKVFSNIPFNITSAIIRKLTLSNSLPEDAFLFVQKEAAMKFAGKSLDVKNSQMSVILYPWFEFSVVHEFKPDDFFPKPNIDIVLLEIKKRSESLIKDKNKYQDFVTYAFNQPKPNIQEGLLKIMRIKSTNLKPSELDFEDWVSLFKLFLTQPERQQNIIRGYIAKQIMDQENLKKIHRTRIDKNWKSY
jgi:23S rRNA (adenine-N6)-dimethyltransferase